MPTGEFQTTLSIVQDLVSKEISLQPIASLEGVFPYPHVLEQRAFYEGDAVIPAVGISLCEGYAFAMGYQRLQEFAELDRAHFYQGVQEDGIAYQGFLDAYHATLLKLFGFKEKV